MQTGRQQLTTPSSPTIVCTIQCYSVLKWLCVLQDKEVRLWDIRTSQCQAVLAGCPSQPTVAIDQQGLVFAVGLANGVIKLYDASHYEQGPFDTFTVSCCMSTLCCAVVGDLAVCTVLFLNRLLEKSLSLFVDAVAVVAAKHLSGLAVPTHGHV